jgi:putative transposase
MLFHKSLRDGILVANLINMLLQVPSGRHLFSAKMLNCDSKTILPQNMPNTYTQISIMAVFAVKNRENFITKPWRDDLHKYLSGIITNQGSKSLAVGGWKDHVHIFFGLKPTIALSDFMQIIKSNSSKWINDNKLVRGKFQWQEGYGAFSYAKSQRDQVINYLINQEEHHRQKNFKEEYLSLLKAFEVEYNETFLWEFYD